MNLVNTHYPPYPLSPRRLIESRGFPSSRAMDTYDRSYLIDRPEMISRSRSYLNCSCGLPITTQGEHLCRSCNLITHAANQVLNIRGGDHCDCRRCNLALDDEERELEVLDRYGYRFTGSDICRSCGRRNCPLDCRPERVPLIPRRAVTYPAREAAYIHRDPLRGEVVVSRPTLLATRARTYA